MLDLIHNLALGFGVALSPMNLFLCLIGALVGTLIGVLPGVGPLATIAMLLPITFGLPPVGALIMLAGIYYGAQYGGSTTSILINIPGESSSVMTTLDGHQMARQGRAGPALSIAAIGSFFAGCVATVLVAALGAPLDLGGAAVRPGGIFFADGAWTVLRRRACPGSVLKALAMVLTGLLLSMVGSDIETGQSRMAFDIPELSDGIGSSPSRWACSALPRSSRNLEPTPNGRDVRQGQAHRLDADLAGSEGFRRRHRPRHCARFDPRHPARRRRRRSRRLPPTRSRRSSPRIPRASAAARSRASRRRKAPTTRQRRPRSFRC